MTTRKDIKKLLKPSNNCSLWRLITENHFDLLHRNVRENQRSNHERENQRHMQLWAHDTERRQTKQKHEKTKKD
jgi:hypothetical protein